VGYYVPTAMLVLGDSKILSKGYKVQSNIWDRAGLNTYLVNKGVLSERAYLPLGA
jgi:hypothetical protein